MEIIQKLDSIEVGQYVYTEVPSKLLESLEVVIHPV